MKTALSVEQLESCRCGCAQCEVGNHCRNTADGCLMPRKTQAGLRLIAGLAKPPRRKRVKAAS